MIKKEPMSVEEMLALPLSRFVERCVDWNEEFNDGKTLNVAEGRSCPVQTWVVANKHKCMNETVESINYCKVCGQPVCPDCMNHNVHQLSRVTGYISNVSGWNEAKKQELKDRKRNF